MECPYCYKSDLHPEASRCPHCQGGIIPTSQREKREIALRVRLVGAFLCVLAIAPYFFLDEAIKGIDMPKVTLILFSVGGLVLFVGALMEPKH